MKILRISASCGSPCGVVSLSQLVEGIDLEDGKYLLSLRDEVFVGGGMIGALDQVCDYNAGEAKGWVRVSKKEGWVVVGVESPNARDCILVRSMIDDRLGVRQVHLSNRPSFIQRLRLLFSKSSFLIER